MSVLLITKTKPNEKIVFCLHDGKKEPQDEPEIVTNDDNIVEDTLVSTNDSSVAKKDSTVAVVETKTTETKKEVKK